MVDDLDMPIALRRSRRSTAASSKFARSLENTLDDVASVPSCLSALKTPNKGVKPKKKVRFSDPYPTLERLSSPLASGLTPMIRRTSLSESSAKSRRHSSPARVSNGSGLQLDLPSPSLSSEVTFLPLRQVLDGRVKRRIRRNGLSEEMNSIQTEKKQRAAETKAEIQRLKEQLAQKDSEIQKLQDDKADDTIIQDNERVVELEREVSELRRQLTVRSGVEATPEADRTYDWTMAARGPFADEYTMLEPSSDPMEVSVDEEFGESTMAELQCSTPSRTTRNRSSFPTPPLTSPATLPLTPSSRYSTPKSHAGVQVAMPDPEKQQLEEETASLQLEICKLTNTLESYQALTTRMAEQLAPFTPPTPTTPTAETANAVGGGGSSSPHPELESQLSHLLQTVSDRTAALLHLSSGLSSLGFPGADASEIIASLAAAFRAARLELEYLTPGEVALPLTSAGAQVLDLVLARLRDLARRGRESDDQIDEYHELELGLRQQLGARVEAMDGLAREVARLEAAAADRTGREAELEVGVDRLKGAVASYARDVAELEGLVQRVEADLAAKTAEADALRGGTADLETRLAAAVELTASLRAELADAAARRAALGRSQGQALALRDARVAELRGEIDRVNEALRAAHETIRQLRVEKAGLVRGLDDEKAKAKVAIDSLKAELERAVKMSQDFLAATPKKAARRGSSAGSTDAAGEAAREGMPVSVLRSGRLLSADLARRNSSDGKGKKRRRYDSGLGFLDEEEMDNEP